MYSFYPPVLPTISILTPSKSGYIRKKSVTPRHIKINLINTMTCRCDGVRKPTLPYSENFNMVSKCRHTQSHPQQPHTFAPIKSPKFFSPSRRELLFEFAPADRLRAFFAFAAHSADFCPIRRPIVERICSVRRSAGRSGVRSLMGSLSVGSGLKGSEEKTRIIFGGGMIRRYSNNY